MVIQNLPEAYICSGTNVEVGASQLADEACSFNCDVPVFFRQRAALCPEEDHSITSETLTRFSFTFKLVYIPENCVSSTNVIYIKLVHSI